MAASNFMRAARQQSGGVSARDQELGQALKRDEGQDDDRQSHGLSLGVPGQARRLHGQ
jgi:hypothetical protein